jgi:hypothetical protein
LVAFTGLFFSTRLPNNDTITRPQLLAATPRLLLDLVAPLEPETPEEREASASRGWSFLPQRFPLWGFAALIAAGAWSLGSLLLRMVPFDQPPGALEREVLAAGVGLSAWSLFVLATGLAGGLSQAGYLVVLVGALVADIVLRQVGSRPKSSQPPPNHETAPPPVRGPNDLPGNVWDRRFSFGSWSHWLAAGCLPFLVLVALGAALPSTDFDVNEYHFGGPKEYFQRGRIEFLPHNVYTSFPFLTEMLTLSGMVVSGDWRQGALVGKCLLALFAPLTAAGLLVLGRRWGGSVAGWGAALVYLSTPWVFRYSTIAYVEGGLACYGLLALMALARAKGSGENALCATSVLWCGVFAGSGMACKYPGLLSAVVPCAVLLAFDGFRAVRRPWKPCAMFVLGVGLAVGPWLAKNLVETGNPVYPLAWSIFGGADWDAELDAKWRRAHGPNGHNLVQMLDLMFDVSVRNDWLSPLLYGLAPLAFWPRRRETTDQRADFDENAVWSRRFACVAAWQFFGWWAFTHRLDRFWTPMLPLVSLLAGLGLARLVATIAPWTSTARRRLAMSVAGGVVVVAGLFNFVFESSGLAGYNDFLRDLPQADRMALRITSPEIAWLNEHAPVGARVLAVGDAEMFGATFPVLYNTVFDRSLFEDLCGEASHTGPAAERPLRDPAALRDAFRSAGITHVYVNWSEILRYRTTYGYTDFVSPERFQALVQTGVLAPPWVLPESLREVEGLAPSWRDVVRKWGATLVRPGPQGDVIPLWEVYEVR